ncbi:hypothetical protein [Streptomyces sp. MBT33]|uniref:hypothetical protein n=1 Tax=Streptomyces sp. MBT33 TaxID=1488363 RepID=UPI001909C3C5|nr:hypothetical protein [Streptomyces sp. MBT33]MBK3640654.1 hypothetical protein [Streptomyces sp. MBT33]
MGPDQGSVQQALWEAHEEAFALMSAKLRNSLHLFQAEGDGYLLAWPSNFMGQVISDYIPAFQENIGKKNVDRAADTLLRVRLALATALAEKAALGIAGSAAIEAKGLVDFEGAKQLQSEFPDQQLVVILSRYVHEQTIRYGWAKGVKKEGFVRVEVTGKGNEKYEGYLTAPGRTAEEVRRIVAPSLPDRIRRYLETVRPRVRRAVRRLRRTGPKLLMVSVAAACAAALLVPVAFSSTRGGSAGDGSPWAEATASSPFDRPGPATSRSLDERPSLAPQPPHSTGADEHGRISSAGGAGRTFRWAEVADGRLRLTSGTHAGRPLALTFDTVSGEVLLRPYAGTVAQHWWTIPVAGRPGVFRIHNEARPDGCLTAHADGHLTLETGCTGDRAQEWTVR